ncbi:MAG: zinc ribbon domain-containing protein, partial [Blastocatellia bacterium]
MNVCSSCNAENPASARFCQMCANPLGRTAEADKQVRRSSPSLSTTVVFSMEPATPQVCPVCEATNDGDWVFCQQCGSKLGQSELDPGEARTPVPKPREYATTLHSSEVSNRASASAEHKCPGCSELIVIGAVFCHKCGAALTGSIGPRTVAMSSVRVAPKAHLLLIVDGEATGEEYEIRGDTVIGRINGDITFPHDDYMSGRHARIAKRGDKFILIDDDSRTGAFIRIKKEVQLESGDYVLLGKQLFRFEV